MTDERTAILVAGSDPGTVDRLAARLRRDWAVRTAYGADAAIRVVHDEAAVAVFDDRLPGTRDRLLPALRAAPGDCRAILLADDGAEPASRCVDRRMARPADPDAVANAVEELWLRARYDELVEEYYDLAVERAALEREHCDPGASSEVHRRLDEVRSDIDDVLDALDDHGAFPRLCRELSPDDPDVDLEACH